LTDVPDIELVRAVVSGDDRAFEVLVVRYGTWVRRTCAQYLSRKEDVEEAVQDTFFRAYQALPSMRCDNLGGWLAQIARNICIDRLRRNKRDPYPFGIVDIIRGAGSSAEEIVAGGDPRVDAALSRLSEAHRSAVQLRFVQEMSHEEMALAIGKTASQVKALVHRARRRFVVEWSVA
jgi:RNA polymerase sigma-70 factor (ECF subfamily)